MPPRQPAPSTERRFRRRLSGLRALVTGASSGVGRALALELARRGVRVLATARRGALLAELSQVPLPAHGASIVTLPADVTVVDARRRLLVEARERLGGLDVVVAAAGAGAVGPFGDADPATLRSVMELDFFAPAELVREALPLLRASGDAAVVLVGSILGLHPLPWHSEYCAAKAALASLAGSLRSELAPDGIQVLLAGLGPTRSEFWENLVAGTRPSWSAGRPLSAEVTAAAIVDALARRRTSVLPGWSAKGFAFAARACPWLIDAVVARQRSLHA